MRILILCTGNSCRSQMAHGILASLDPSLKVFSAGTKPAEKINPLAVGVMAEIGIDISANKPVNVNKYLGDKWDYVITVCGGANESCPAFIGNVRHRLHIGFEDPSESNGSDPFVMSEFRRIRDAIKESFSRLYHTELQYEKPRE